MATEGSISSTLPTQCGDDADPNIVSISDVLSNEKFNRYLLFNFLFIGSSFLPSVFIVDYGARWFAGCNPNSTDICYGIDYTKLNFYQSLSTSMRGTIAFFFAGFVGRLSDAYGRKIFLLLHPILYSLQILPLIVANNYLWYLLLTPLAGFVGASLGLSPMMSAYISDVLPSEQRTFGFAVSYGSAGVALLISAIISLMVSLYMTDYINFVLILILYIGQTIYIWFCIEESLQDQHIKPLSKKKLINPLRPLLQIRNNRIVFWISFVQFLITFMEVGILNICMVYILTELDITNNDSNFLLMFTFIISVSFGLFGATAGIIPMSRKYKLDCCWSTKYKPLTINNLNEINYKMSLTEQSQMSELTMTAEHTVDISLDQRLQQIQRDRLSINRIRNTQYSTDSMLEDITCTDIDEDNNLIINSNPRSPITYNNNNNNYHHNYYHHTQRNKRLFPYNNNKRNRNYNMYNINNINGFSSSLSHLDDNDNNIINYRMPSRTWMDYNNLVIGTFLSFLSLLGIGCVAWIHNTIYIGLCGICVGCAVGITFPSANGVATNSLRNDEQGKGFGIIYAVKGVTSAIAPFAFGTFYNYLVSMNAGPIIFLIGMILTFIALIIIIFPLRWVLCDQQGTKRKNCLLNPKHNITTYT